MMQDLDWQADLGRLPSRKGAYREQSLWAIWVYRLGRRNLCRRPGFTTWSLEKIYWFLFLVVTTITGISLPRKVQIGGGLRIYHFGGVFINEGVVLGRNCTLRQGVTIGNRYPEGGKPVIGDDVEFGAYAQVLGDIRIGDRSKIGALSLVLCDVPAGATAVGIPARVVSEKS